jgi:hypothetical protein
MANSQFDSLGRPVGQFARGHSPQTPLRMTRAELEPLVMTRAEAVRELGVSDWMIYSYWRRGWLVPLTNENSRAIAYSRADVEAFKLKLAARRAEKEASV